MDLRELKTFCTAARLRSISKAAEHLRLGQPTATTHIKKLEKELGVALFDRVKRPIQLTPAGSELLQRGSPLVEAMDSLVADIGTARDGGAVTVATTTDIMSHKLLSTVRAYRHVHPDVHMFLRSRRRQEVLELVESGAVDIGIIPGTERRLDMDFEGLFPYDRVLITPLHHPRVGVRTHQNERRLRNVFQRNIVLAPERMMQRRNEHPVVGKQALEVHVEASLCAGDDPYVHGSRLLDMSILSSSTTTS